MRARGWLWIFGALLLASCETYTTPHRLLPENLQLKTLDGQTLTREDLAGKPWVINLWVPG
jgi:hypothetical protein